MSGATAQNTTVEKKQIVLLSVAGIFLSLVITSIILGVPYYNYIKQNSISNLQLLTNNKAQTLSHQLYRYRKQAQSISQRIHATRLLAKYTRNEISLAQFKLKTSGILKEAISQADDIVGVIRLSKDYQLLLELGLEIQPNHWQGIVKNGLIRSNPHMIRINDQDILLLISSIYNHRGDDIGADIVALKTSKLDLRIKQVNHDGLPIICRIFSAQNNKVNQVLPYQAQNAAINNDNEIISNEILHHFGKGTGHSSEINQHVVTHAQVKGTPWVVSVSINKNQLYRDLTEKIYLVGVELLILLLVASFLMLRIMRPLSHKIVQHSEQIQQQTEERFRALVETTNDWIWEIDKNHKYTYSSPAIEFILGYTNDEIIGQTPFDFIHKDEVESIIKQFSKLSQTHQPMQSLVNTNVHKDGHKVILETSGVPYFSESGEFIGYRGVDRDITSRKAIEDELELHQNHLEEMIKKRTSELVELNQELASFSYTVSHDLRTPLRAIDGFTSALQEECSEQFDETGKNYFVRIRQAARKMGEIIDALLMLTRITRQEVTIKKTCLSSMVSLSLDHCREVDKNRKVEVTITPELYALCDKKLMQIVIDNLIGNAWKFTSNKTPASIEFGSVIKEGNTVYYVKDNGAGFDTEYAGKIFQPFQRLHTDKEYSGTGIGLATVQRIIQRHEGKIWVVSSLNQGAIFYFTLGNGIHGYEL